MNIGLFGGTFDPIHKGHLALAQAARERCQLGSINFVPTNVPPHKTVAAGSVLLSSLCHDSAGDAGREGVRAVIAGSARRIRASRQEERARAA